jgi:hypothetical protein
MNNQYNYNKIFNTSLEEHRTEMTLMQFRHTGELLCFQYHMKEVRLSKIDYNNEPKKYKVLHSLALKSRELAESVTECAEEYEYQDLQMYLEAED